MIFYFGNNAWKFLLSMNPPLRVPAACYSYFYKCPEILELFAKQKTTAFIDSGAFSYQQQLRKSGKKPTIEEMKVYQREYAAWVLKCGFKFDFHVPMDYEPTPKATRDSMAFLKRLGLDTIPVFHNGTSIDWLKTYLDEGYALLALSRANSIGSRDQTRPFLDACFDVVTRGKYDVKLHGFACTGSEISQYPWWSVDSTSWMMAAAKGYVYQLEGFKLTQVPSSTKQRKGGDKATDSYVLRFFHNIEVVNTLVAKINDRAKPTVRRSLF